MIGCVGLVLGFRTSSNLAAAYGIAVTTTMVITSILFYVVARRRWGWSPAKAAARRRARSWSSTSPSSPPTSPRSPRAAGSRCSSLSSCSCRWPRGAEGGSSSPSGSGAPNAASPRSSTTRRGHQRPRHRRVPVQGPRQGAAGADQQPAPQQGPSREDDRRGRRGDRRPLADGDERRPAGRRSRPGLHQIQLCFGFMEEPDVPAALALIEPDGLPIDLADATYFVGRESVTKATSRACTPPSSASSSCSTAAPTAPPGSSTCPRTGSSRSAPTSSCECVCCV